MKSKVRPRESATRAQPPPALQPPSVPTPREAQDTHGCWCSRMIYAFITTVALQTPLVAPTQHRRVSRLHATWGTVASAGSPSQPPHRHQVDIVTPERSPSAASGMAHGEPRDA